MNTIFRTKKQQQRSPGFDTNKTATVVKLPKKMESKILTKMLKTYSVKALQNIKSSLTILQKISRTYSKHT